MPPLGSDDRRTLLEIARRAVTLAIQKRERLRLDIPPGILSEPAGAFVTLQRHKRLRGCIGRLAPSEPLAQVVADSAMSAALEDPRFEPLRPEELAEVEIEISVLSKFAPIAREEIQPGTHGLVIQRGNLRGLLLPQVATEYNWSRERFLEETCVKAGLPRDAWRDGATQISGFTAEVFSEEDFRK